MSIMQSFIKRLKDKAIEKPFNPRFKVGDIIKNNKVQCVAEVTRVYWSRKKDPTGAEAVYRLKYFKNPAAHKVVGDVVGLHGEYSRTKYIQKIDSYYELVAPEVVQLLYQKKSEVNNEPT